MDTEAKSHTVTWGRVVAIVAVGVVLVLAVALFLVLTGIIAEPETLIESVIRAIIGR